MDHIKLDETHEAVSSKKHRLVMCVAAGPDALIPVSGHTACSMCLHPFISAKISAEFSDTGKSTADWFWYVKAFFLLVYFGGKLIGRQLLLQKGFLTIVATVVNGHPMDYNGLFRDNKVLLVCP